MEKNPIIIIGMARSGTTLVSHVLGSLSEAHTEVEPHALWKSGNFQFLNDQEYRCSESISSRIRNKFLKSLPQGKTLVEKSPINSIRPDLVYSVFPDARIIYIERDPVRCIYSNYSRSLSNDSFKFSIILKKYFFYTGSKDLDGAIGKRGLFKQLSFNDIPLFIRYSLYMMYLRNFRKCLPFGVKLKNFDTIVKNHGLLYYHVKVHQFSKTCKSLFKEKYGDNMEVFRMEDIMNSTLEIERLIAFSGLSYTIEQLETIKKSFDSSRVQSASKSNVIDSEIRTLLKNV